MRKDDMMRLCYSRCGRPSAEKIAAESDKIELTSARTGDVNWGKETADTTLNPDISNVTNKRAMRELFALHGVPMPRLIDSAELHYAISNGKILVGRPDKHTKGRGYWLCRNWGDVYKAMRGTRKKKAATHFMEFVEADHEYRVHVFRGKSIRISEKSFFGEGKEREYTTIKPKGEIRHVRKAAKQALAAVALDFGAVDVLATSAACWVLEVNASPGLGGTLPSLYARTFERWYEDADN